MSREKNLALALLTVFLISDTITDKKRYDQTRNEEEKREAVLTESLHQLEELRDVLVEIDIDGVYVRKVDSIGVKINSLTCCY